MLFEGLERREVMDATLHNVSAAYIDVVQVDTGNNETSIITSLPLSINDFRLRSGQSRGDLTVQIGASATDDVAQGILLTSINDNGRDNGEGAGGVPAIQFGITAVNPEAAGSYYIATHSTSAFGGFTGGGEYNYNVSAAYFPFADGWIGGLANNSTNANGGVNNRMLTSSGLQIDTHYFNAGAGISTVDLRSMGINSLVDGVLLVNHGKNENNFALSRANADGTWSVFTKGHNQDGGNYEQDPVAFVYVPKTNTTVVSGKFRGDLTAEIASAPFTVTNPGTGIYHLEIPGYAPDSGVLIISAEGGSGNPVDNPVSFVANGNGWDIHTRDLPNMGLQNIGPTDPVVSFVFIPGRTPGLKVTPSVGLLTTEAGGTAIFDLTLDTRPTADVTITLTSSNPAEGTISVPSVTFTPDNWNVPQAVTVTGQDDAVVDGAVEYTIITDASTSLDPTYAALAIADISLRNADNEAGITVNPIAGLTTTEAGGTASFSVVLNAAPTGDVMIGLSSSNTGEGTVSVPSLTFTSVDWNVPQIVTVTGVNDDVDSVDVYSIITAAATSADPIYDGLDAADVTLTNLDNDEAKVIIVPVVAVSTTEAGAPATFTARLQTKPIADVTISMTSSDPLLGNAPASIVFTPDNWNIEQTVNVTATDDLVRDGAQTFSVITTASSTDPAYNNLEVRDVTVNVADNETLLTLPQRALVYGLSGPAIPVAPQSTVTDVDTADFDTGTLTVTQTGSTEATDRLEIRNIGTAAGEISVAGNEVSFGGTAIGTFAGGSGSTPLVVTFNAAATPAATQALLRAINYRNILSTPAFPTRALSFVLTDGDGGVSNTAAATIALGEISLSLFQEGVDAGVGTYTGQADIQLAEATPNDPLPIGNGTELLVDWPDIPPATNTSQILMRFDNIFGTGPGQIPLGATIVGAELVVNVSNTGDGGTLHRMLIPWDATLETWNTIEAGVQTNDVEARAVNDSAWGLIDGSGATGTGRVSIGVTPDIQAWSNGETNLGWVITGWPERRDGTAFSPGESTDPTIRPQLRVVWVPSGVQSVTFRDDPNGIGYTGTEDVALLQASPEAGIPNDLFAFVDASNANNESQFLLKFNDIIGTGPGQIPPGSRIHAAALTLASTNPDAMGHGGRFYTMNEAWSDATATWNLFGNDGIQPGIEASETFNTQAGNASRTPLVQGGFNPFDVSADLQAWVSGVKENHGWAILPWAGGTDGWGFVTSDAFVEKELPTLQVFFTPPGITVTPESGLVTSESGASNTFTIQLDTPPSADVTIPLSSSNTAEGTVAPASVTFTPSNWNIPQTVTVTGVDDAISDGPITYSIVTGPATSTDSAYSGLDAADVSVSNSDNDAPGVTLQPTSGLITTEAGATATFTAVLDFAPTADVIITLNSSNTAEGTVGPATLTFTTTNWNVPQTVTVTGVDDDDVDGAVDYSIITSAATSADPGYNGLAVGDVTVTNQDNDVAGVTITPTAGLKTSEAGGTATFSVKLSSRPSADVTFDLSSNDTSEGTVGPGSLTFTALNWNVEQIVTITGVADAEIDVSVDYSIVTSKIISADLNYNDLDPADVTVTNVDSQPIVTLPSSSVVYGIGGTPIGIDGQATLIDLDSANFDTGVLTVTLTTGATADDRLEVRNTGSGPGQVGVSGSNVTFGGVTVGTFAGGAGTTPLTVTFNADATPAIAEQILRSITFRNVGTSLATTTRTVSVTVSDGDGFSNAAVNQSLTVGNKRGVSFQEGVDHGLGVYTGTADVEISLAQPATTFPEGSTASGLTVVHGASESQTLIRFEGLFGNGPGQIPPGSLITFAELVLDVNNTGFGPRLHRMLQTWDANSATWNSLGGGVQPDDVEARMQADSSLTNATGLAAATTAGSIGIGVLPDLQAWSNGDANNGWAMITPTRAAAGNDFAFSASESSVLTDRPRLRVEWIPPGAEVKSFREDVNGYTGTSDIQLTQNSPDTPSATSDSLNVDFNDAGSTNNVHVLMKFEDIIGNAISQVPAGAIVYAATLTLPATISNNAPGDGGSFHRMLQPWDETATWNSMTNGLSADGTEASTTISSQAGNASRNPDAQAGFNIYDMTKDVQDWVNGAANHGWAMIPWNLGSNGWIINSSEAPDVNTRPMLTIYHSQVPGVSITETDGTTAVEENGPTDTVSLVLRMQPTADVTITVDGGAQLTSSPTTLTFTPANWDTPQTVTISAVNDGTVEGPHSGTVTFTAASSDAGYNGLAIGSVNVSITEPLVFGVSTFTNTGSTFAVRFTDVLDPTRLNLVDSNNALGPTDITITGATGGAVRGSVIMDADNRGFIFIKTGGELVPDTYTVTLRSAANGVATPSGVELDGDNNGTAGGDYVTQFTVNAPAPGTIIVSAPDFVRGYGQPVNLPANSTNGIPITINSGVNVGSVTFTLNYNPALLTITGGTTPLAGATINVDTTTPGVAIVTVSSGTEFSSAAGLVTIANLAATVPEGASNGSKHLLDVGGVSVLAVDSSPLPNAADDGIHVAAYRGDLNNSGTITTGDVTALLRSISGALSTTGFANLKLSDPVLLGDMNDSSSLTTGDATGLLRFISGAAGGFPAIPALPTGLPAPPPGADPEIFIPDNLIVSPGSALTVPVNINVTEPSGISLAGFDVTITFDATRFTFGSATVGGALTGFSFSSSNNTATPGTIRLVYAADVGPVLANGFIGTLVNVTLNALPAAEAGSSALNITAAAASDNDTNDLLIQPAVTAAPSDPSDGSVTVEAAATAGIIVTPTTGLTTTEVGGTATFTVVLNTQPTADVTIALSSSDTTEGTVSPASVTFTTANWNVAQTITVTGVDDAVVDGAVAYTINTAAAVSADANYSGLNADDVSLSNTDNDVAGITVTPTAGLTTTEAGGTATFTIVLNSQPTSDVTIPLSSDDTTEGTVAPASVTFTAANWNVAQTVTVTGVDDPVVDGNDAYTIVTGLAESLDLAYVGLTVADVSVTNIDNDVVGITVTPTAGLTTTEAGGTATFTIVLTTQPTANVTIPLSSNDTTEGTVSPASVTFTTANWNVPQTVTVTGVDDFVVDGSVAYTIVTDAATSTDLAYNGFNAADVGVSNTDNDVAGITVTPTSGLTTTETGGIALFTVVLNTQPTGNVIVPLSSSDTTEGTVATASLTFTVANWNVPQFVTVTGADDAIADGTIAYSIITAPATSTDANYSGVDPADVSLNNVDDEVAVPAGITVTPTSGLITTEAGGTATFTIVLNSAPTASVMVPLSSSDTTEGTVSPSSVTFTTANWNVPQTVTVTGADDAIVDGIVPYTIVTGPATSTDPAYSGFDANDVGVSNSDNDVAGPGSFTVSPTSGLNTTESGGIAVFTIVLNTQPAADVIVPLTSSDTTEGTVSPASITFTAANWNVPQLVTVTGADDAIVDGNVSYTIITGAATSTDVNYSGVNPADVSLNNVDNEVAVPAGVTVAPTSGLITTEAGGTATFTIVLNSQPTSNVTIPLSSSDSTEGTVSPSSVTFTTANWNVPQTVTVTGVDDANVDGTVAYMIVTGPATSTDPAYSGINANDVGVSNTDNDVAGPGSFTVSPTTGLTTTESGGVAAFTIVLNTQPNADVTVPLTSSDTTEGTMSQASITFTATNWNVPQLITVTGADDAIVDGTIAYTIITGAATSTDVNYSGVNPVDVSLSNVDNEVATPSGINVTPTAGLTTTEAGGTATFAVVLTSQPTANVTVPLTSSDSTEGTVSPASITFTTANWNVPQSVTVTGVDDAIADGNVAFTILTGPATSTDVSYNGVNPADVSVTNIDNDSTGNTPPTISDIGNQTGNENTPLNGIAFTVNDAETPAGNLTVSGTSSNTTLFPAGSITFGGSGANRTISLNPAANQSGTATITVTVADGAGGQASDTFTVTVTGAAAPTPTTPGTAQVVNDPENPGRGVLVINGTSNLDLITVLRSGSNSTLVLVPLSGIYQTFDNSTFDRILINAYAGSDRIIFDPFLDKPVTIYGGDGDDIILSGAGNDTIYGGSGTDVVYGRAGNDFIFGEAGRDYLYGDDGDDVIAGGTDDDVIWGGNGRDVLNGGGGLDYIYGFGGDDLIMAGNLSQSNSIPGMQSIQSKWTANQAFDARIASLAAEVNQTTVTNDGRADWIFGMEGRDWIVDYALQDLIADFNANSTNGDRRN